MKAKDLTLDSPIYELGTGPLVEFTKIRNLEWILVRETEYVQVTLDCDDRTAVMFLPNEEESDEVTSWSSDDGDYFTSKDALHDFYVDKWTAEAAELEEQIEKLNKRMEELSKI